MWLSQKKQHGWFLILWTSSFFKSIYFYDFYIFFTDIPYFYISDKFEEAYADAKAVHNIGKCLNVSSKSNIQFF